MSAASEYDISVLLSDATQARQRLVSATNTERLAVVAFMDEAVRQNWSWYRIARALGVTDTAARRYYQRNRRKVRSVVV